ncbi:MAG: chitobiase/beta-hexosaminidase C-terminal domain-containing protein, partial [archaeon]
MTQNEIKTLEDIDKKSISSIIVVILIVLIAVILIGMILTWSKDTVKTKLDDATENMKVLSELECSNAKYEVEFCNINTVTKNIDFLITNNSGVDFSYFTLSVFGKNISGDSMVVTGLFNTNISSGSSKLLSTNSDYYSVVKQDSNLSLLDLDQEYTFNLVSATCPNSVVDLSCTSAAEYTSSPIFSIPDGNYYLSQNVIISTDSDAVIYYTLDGTNPTTSSLVYSSAINLLEDTTTTIKAIAVKPGYLESTVSTGTYIITHTLTTLGASPAAGSYYSIQNVTLSGEAGSTIYYTIDGSTPTTGS